MKENCSCGFILIKADNGIPTGVLLCHPTNSGNRWDFPKGMADPGEPHFRAAVRELREETGLNFLTLDTHTHSKYDVVDLGQHPYLDNKDLHMYLVTLDYIDTRNMVCESMVENKKGPNFPEMDAFAVFPIDQLLGKVGNRMSAWLQAHLPKELLPKE